jgi:hypothetical protein
MNLPGGPQWILFAALWAGTAGAANVGGVSSARPLPPTVPAMAWKTMRKDEALAWLPAHPPSEAPPSPRGLQADVFESRASGAPVRPPAFAGTAPLRDRRASFDRSTFLRSQMLSDDPRVKTLVVAVSPTEEKPVTQSLQRAFAGQLVQMVVLRSGEALTGPIPLAPGMTMSYAPRDFRRTVSDYLMAGNLYVTSSASPEAMLGYAVGVPMVTLGLTLPEERGVALRASGTEDVGDLSRRLVDEFALKNFLTSHQGQLRERIDVQRAPEAFAQLRRELPGDVELLTDLGRFAQPRGVKTPDPTALLSQTLGHNALALDGDVYSVTGVRQSQRRPGDQLMNVRREESYLFPAVTTESVRPFRTTVGVRIAGFTPQQKAAMQARREQLNAEWARGTRDFGLAKGNCADMTAELLRAGGLALPDPVCLSTPEGLVRRVLAAVEWDPRFSAKLVLYSSEAANRGAWRSLDSPLTGGLRDLPFDRVVERVPGVADLVSVRGGPAVSALSPFCRFTLGQMNSRLATPSPSP